MPVGIIRMSPHGELFLNTYHPGKDGGPRGYEITKGWSMQTVVPKDAKLCFYEYWAPLGFSSMTETGAIYGIQVLKDVKDKRVLQKFKEAHEYLLTYLQKIA